MLELALALLSMAALTGGTPVPRGGCDASIPAITAGYGAKGAFAVDQVTIPNPVFAQQPVTVFLPRGLRAAAPVVFFAHGFGPGRWETYSGLIHHLVSRGFAVVFSTYPMAGASLEGRYDALWAGFQSAADKLPTRLDLTRVAFVGHSFGGGATPAMAYRGIVHQGWGARGALVMELAPWYSIGVTDAYLSAMPARVVQAVEVYDQDTTNDPRMAIDLYAHSPSLHRYFFSVQSATVDGCALLADHSTPGRNASERQREYGVYRPLDALLALAFGDADAADSLQAMAASPPVGAYQPVRLETNPVPDDAGRRYANPWDDRRNPRRAEAGGAFGGR